MLKFCLVAAVLVGVVHSYRQHADNEEWEYTERMLTTLGRLDTFLARTVRHNDKYPKHIFSIIAVLMLRIVSPTNKRLREVDLANDPVDVIASEPVRQLDLLRTTLAPVVLVIKQARSATKMEYADAFNHYYEKQKQLCPSIGNHETLRLRTQQFITDKATQDCLHMAFGASMVKPTPERPALELANHFFKVLEKNKNMFPGLVENATRWFQEFHTTNYRCNLAQPK